jgi:hypothetical protein
MSQAAHERVKSSFSVINETTEQIVFYELLEEKAKRSIIARVRLFWPVMRNLRNLVQHSYCVHSVRS